MGRHLCRHTAEHAFKQCAYNSTHFLMVNCDVRSRSLLSAGGVANHAQPQKAQLRLPLATITLDAHTPCAHLRKSAPDLTSSVNIHHIRTHSCLMTDLTTYPTRQGSPNLWPSHAQPSVLFNVFASDKTHLKSATLDLSLGVKVPSHSMGLTS